MDQRPNISFEDTSVAFTYKSNKELRRANLIFSLVNHPWISAAATGFASSALKIGLPIEGIIRNTVFKHFCGGETIQDSEKAIARLWEFRVGTILDYSVEGEKSERGFDQTTNELLRTIEKAATTEAIPFSVFKLTGIASFDLLEKIQRKATLDKEEVKAFQRVRERVDKICGKAHALKVPILVDAEETWIQDPIDQLAYEMMVKFNRDQPIVFNTFQLYRKDTLQNLKNAYSTATRLGYHLGAKLVRGAYMEKERARALTQGFESPIQPDKTASDNAFNEALLFCTDNLTKMGVMCGSHNEYSNLYFTKLMDERGIAPGDKRCWFGQLYGMSDNISFNLAKAGYNVGKYVPYGPVKSVMPYLLRRAAENTSVAGQSSRELILIRKELARRKQA
jgi:proline dehydrogenase